MENWRCEWIPRPSTLSFIDPPIIHVEMKVVELKIGGGEWNVELIRSMSGRKDAEAILSIPYNGVRLEDVLR